MHTRLQLKGQTHEIIEEEGRRGQQRTGEEGEERQILQVSVHKITVKADITGQCTGKEGENI